MSRRALRLPSLVNAQTSRRGPVVNHAQTARRPPPSIPLSRSGQVRSPSWGQPADEFADPNPPVGSGRPQSRKPIETDPVVTEPVRSAPIEHHLRNRLIIVASLAVATTVVALLRFDLLPLLHVTGETFIYALIFTTIVLICFVFYVLCRGFVLLLRRRFRLPFVILLLLFIVFAALYLSLNVIAQVYDPTIDRVLASLPAPGRKLTFLRRRDAYEQVAFPFDRRISADEIANSGARDVLIAVEDERLDTRFGPIDLEALLRGAVRTFVLRDRREGGSTILVQAAKNVLRVARSLEHNSKNDSAGVPSEQAGKESLQRALSRKGRELLLSLRLAQRFPRSDEQLALYASIAPMGGRDSSGRDHTFAYLAADLFGVNDLRSLKRTDANDVLSGATLVGMLKAPTSYHPRLHPEAAIQRRNVALAQISKAGVLAHDLSTLQAQPIKLRDANRARSVDFYYSSAAMKGAL